MATEREQAKALAEELCRWVAKQTAEGDDPATILGALVMTLIALIETAPRESQPPSLQMLVAAADQVHAQLWKFWERREAEGRQGNGH